MKIVLDKGAILPTRAHPKDAGLDLYAKETILLPPCTMAVTDTGVHVEIPEHCVGLIKSRSGMMSKMGITTDGTIDVGYTGSIRVMLFNHSRHTRTVERGDRIAQLVVTPILFPSLEVVENLNATERGDGGLGSTGR